MICFFFLLFLGGIIVLCVLIWEVGFDIFWSLCDKLFWGLIFFDFVCIGSFFSFWIGWVFRVFIVIFLVVFRRLICGVVGMIWIFFVGILFVLGLIFDIEDGFIELIDFCEDCIVGFWIGFVKFG